MEEQVNPFAANDTTDKKKNEVPTALRARGRACRGEYFWIVAVRNDSDSLCINAISNEDFADKIRWNPKLIDIFLDLLDPHARDSTVFPGENCGKLSRRRTPKIGRPLMT